MSSSEALSGQSGFQNCGSRADPIVLALSEPELCIDEDDSAVARSLDETVTVPWYELVSKLQERGPPCGKESSSLSSLASSLEAAIDSAVADENWSDSGIVELLRGALELTMEGRRSAAWKTAVELLEFQRIAENVRRLYTSTPASRKQSRAPSSRPIEPTVDGAQLEPNSFPVPKKRRNPSLVDTKPAKKGRTLCAPSISGNASSNAPTVSTKYPNKVSHKLVVAKTALCSDDSGPCHTAKEDQASFNWTGCIKHKLMNTELELCGLSIRAPKAFAREFNNTLYVSNLTQRKNVLLGKHHVCRCSIRTASENQLSKLRCLAQYELVAVVLLRRGCFILVPYFDNQGVLRVVGFLL